jgi:plasmid stabilization system protein ParE
VKAKREIPDLLARGVEGFGFHRPSAAHEGLSMALRERLPLGTVEEAVAEIHLELVEGAPRGAHGPSETRRRAHEGRTETDLIARHPRIGEHAPEDARETFEPLLEDEDEARVEAHGRTRSPSTT